MVLERLLQKRASLTSDIVGGLAGDALLAGPLGLPTYTVGSLHGLVSDIDKDEVKQHDKQVGMAFIPGVGASRLMRRQRAVDAATGDDNGTLHRVLGRLSNPVLLSLLGMGAGALLDSENRFRGAGVGAFTGLGTSVLSDIGGMLLAGGTKHRNLQDHKANRASALANYLIPGRAAYETYKTLGTSEDLGMFPNKVNVKG